MVTSRRSVMVKNPSPNMAGRKWWQNLVMLVIAQFVIIALI